MKIRFTPILLAFATMVTGCSTIEQTPEEVKLSYRADACSNPELALKPVWCPASRSPLQLSVEEVRNPKGSIVQGRLVP
jgi:predicted component of type VI protein secretion system